MLGAGAAKLICFVPGRGFEMFHDGVAKRVPAGRFLRWSLHYNVTGRPETDHSRIGIWKARGFILKWPDGRERRLSAGHGVCGARASSRCASA